jgi:hypothetical protein
MLVAMLGPIIFAVLLVVVIPVGFLMSTTVAAGVLGFLLTDDAERRHKGSPLVDTSR